jgi:hypothetical protein
MTPETRDTETQFDYPEELPDRLAWFTKQAGVGEIHLLYLLGVVPEGEAHVDWGKVVARHEDAAVWLEGMLYDALAVFNYDAGAMRDRLSRAPKSDDLPLPPGRRWPASGPTEDGSDFFRAWNLAAVAQLGQGGPGALPTFIAFLSQPAGAFKALWRK